MRTPNFFMIGAPKCGTSAMATYLHANPQVYFCRPREPHYWAFDFPKLQKYYGITTLEKYLQLFEDAGPKHVAIGDKSTCYLASKTAVRQIRAFDDSAKVLVMLRNPLHMIQSWHHMMVVDLNENVADFELAWNLQSRRAQGQDIPATCLVPEFLQYREWACYAAYLKEVVKIVPADQLKIVIFEEFIAEPRRIYCEVCSFLGVDDDGRTDFPPVGESHVHALPAIGRLIMRPPSWFEPVAIAIRRRAHQKPSGIISFAKRFIRRKEKRRSLRSEFEQHLRETFAADITWLEDILGRPLEVWRNDPKAG